MVLTDDGKILQNIVVVVFSILCHQFSMSTAKKTPIQNRISCFVLESILSDTDTMMVIFKGM